MYYATLLTVLQLVFGMYQGLPESTVGPSWVLNAVLSHYTSDSFCDAADIR